MNKNTLMIGRDQFKFHSGGFCMIERRASLPNAVPRNIKSGSGFMSKPTGFRADPKTGAGWWTVGGRRFNLVWPSKSFDSPIAMVLDAAVHQCEPVPDQLYSGLQLSDAAYFWLQKFQLERHLAWRLRSKYRMKAENRQVLVERGVSAFVNQIRYERKIDLNGPLDDLYSEADLLLLEEDERVRDFVRRYGRDARNIRT